MSSNCRLQSKILVSECYLFILSEWSDDVTGYCDHVLPGFVYSRRLATGNVQCVCSATYQILFNIFRLSIRTRIPNCHWFILAVPRPRRGKRVCGGAKIFGSALLQPAHSAQCLRRLWALVHRFWVVNIQTSVYDKVIAFWLHVQSKCAKYWNLLHWSKKWKRWKLFEKV